MSTIAGYTICFTAEGQLRQIPLPNETTTQSTGCFMIGSA
jgi:hypothetical protein